MNEGNRTLRLCSFVDSFLSFVFVIWCKTFLCTFIIYIPTIRFHWYQINKKWKLENFVIYLFFFFFSSFNIISWPFRKADCISSNKNILAIPQRMFVPTFVPSCALCFFLLPNIIITVIHFAEFCVCVSVTKILQKSIN